MVVFKGQGQGNKVPSKKRLSISSGTFYSVAHLALGYGTKGARTNATVSQMDPNVILCGWVVLGKRWAKLGFFLDGGTWIWRSLGNFMMPKLVPPTNKGLGILVARCWATRGEMRGCETGRYASTTILV